MNKFCKPELILLVTGILFCISATMAPAQQSDGEVTATGEICFTVDSHYQTQIHEITFTFNPAGGPVTGEAGWTEVYVASGDSGTITTNLQKDMILSGDFEGGDGGKIVGNLTWSAYQVITNSDGSGPFTKNESGTGTWEGILWANGTGSGQFSETCPWNVTFSAADFQAALVMPTTISETADILVGPSANLVKSWPELDAAIAQILNQDEAIISRDEQNVYYVIDNQGNQKYLPPELQSVLKMNNEFGLLQNTNLLWANPAVQAFVAANGNDVKDAISGSGKFEYYTIPQWLKQRQYMKISTECGEGNCRTVTMISMVDTSFIFHEVKSASAEHSSIRGTINGGGDFIYVPVQEQGGKLASLSLKPQSGLQNSGSQPYLGIQVSDTADRAIITMVQHGSPADEAGLVINDQIVSVSGTFIDNQNTLLAIINKYSGGDKVELGVIRSGGDMNASPIFVTLATVLPPLVVTPAAEITVSENTKFMVDIGLNGVTGVFVLSDKAHVREPATGSEMDVPAGSAVIIVPGYQIGPPVKVENTDIMAWWTGEIQPTQSAPDPSINKTSTILLLVGGCSCLLVIAVSVTVIVLLIIRKKRQPVSLTHTLLQK